MREEFARKLLAKAGAIIEGHFVGTNGNHLSVYVAKDRATRLTHTASMLCAGIAKIFADENIEAVVAPAVGGIPLAQWTAHHLTNLRQDRPEVLAVYTEHEDEVLYEHQKDESEIIALGAQHKVEMRKGEKIILRHTSFVLARGFKVDVQGKRALEVEDILTTGGSARATAEAIKDAGGILIGLGVLANGGHVTAEDCEVDRLEALMNVERLIYTETECAHHGLCAQGVPINTDFGHGKAFLARQGAKVK